MLRRTGPAKSEKFQALTKRIEALPYGKRKRLLADKIPEGFAARDATDSSKVRAKW